MCHVDCIFTKTFARTKEMRKKYVKNHPVKKKVVQASAETTIKYATTFFIIYVNSEKKVLFTAQDIYIKYWRQRTKSNYTFFFRFPKWTGLNWGSEWKCFHKIFITRVPFSALPSFKWRLYPKKKWREMSGKGFPRWYILKIWTFPTHYCSRHYFQPNESYFHKTELTLGTL